MLFTRRIQPPSGGTSLLQVTTWQPRKTQLPVRVPHMPSRTKINLDLSGSQLTAKLVSEVLKFLRRNSFLLSFWDEPKVVVVGGYQTAAV